jgi:ferredoxin
MTQRAPCTSGLESDSMANVFRVELKPAGLLFNAPSSLSLLQAAELASPGSHRIESSCRNGSCRSCMCRLSSGQVSYRIEWPGLSAAEKIEGYILPCVAYPMSDVVLELPFQTG